MPKLIDEYNKKTTEYICMYDSAIDQDKTNMEEYQKTRDVNLLVFKPMKKPTKFFIRNIPYQLASGIQMITTPQRMYHDYFSVGIERIENLKPEYLNDGIKIVNDGNDIWEPDEIVEIDDVLKIKTIEPEQAMRLFNSYCVREVGSFVEKKTHCPPVLKPTYPIWHSSIELMGLTKYL